ncbi:MAG TPA: response regulator transcription factor [Candidatus Dormibacteraeota bacterium]|nr:response regulator transcription factor [Candidatus Dormibacteraeota bacterium]
MQVEAVHVRVLVADPAALIRAGLRALLGSAPGFEVVGEAADGRAAIDEARRLRPDAVLTGLRLDAADGLEIVRLLATGPQPDGCAVIVVTDPDPGEPGIEALRAGARGLVARDGPAEHVVAAVRAATAGGVFLTQPALGRLLERRRRPSPAGEPVLDALTGRQLAVLRLLAAGLSNAEIAGRLHVAEPTVKTHVQHLFEKLRVRNRAEAVALAHRAGLAE